MNQPIATNPIPEWLLTSLRREAETLENQRRYHSWLFRCKWLRVLGRTPPVVVSAYYPETRRATFWRLLFGEVWDND